MSTMITPRPETAHLLQALFCPDCGNPFQMVGTSFDILALLARTHGDIPCARCERLRRFEKKEVKPWQR